MENNIHEDINVLIKRRLDELDELQKINIPAYAYSYDVNNYSKNIKDNYEELEQKDVKIAGRIMAIRRTQEITITTIRSKSHEEAAVY